jgi:hypothetical protein
MIHLIHTIEIKSQLFKYTNLLNIQQSDAFQLVSKMNNIKVMYITTELTSKEIQCLMKLFPGLQCFWNAESLE